MSTQISKMSSNSNVNASNRNYKFSEIKQRLEDPNANDENIDEDESSEVFSGATLSLSQIDNQVKDEQMNGNQPTPIARSVSVTSTSSSSETGIQQFFGLREGALEEAVLKCKPVILNRIDGELIGVWLLTVIDHWDIERERLVFLTDYSLIVLKYDFIAQKLLKYNRIPLLRLDKVVVGNIRYPEGSLLPARNQVGVRVLWNQGEEVHFSSKWNPFSEDIPWITFTSHPLVSSNTTVQKETCDVDDFTRMLLQNIRKETVNTVCQILNKPIVVENYANLISVVHNISGLGFFKNRGKLSF